MEQKAKLSLLILIISALLTASLEIFTAQPWGDNYAYQDYSGYLVLACFVIWNLAPYVTLALLVYRDRKNSKHLIILLIGIIVIVSISIFWLIDTLFIHMSSTSGLIFLSLPLCQFIAILILKVIRDNN